MTDISQDIKSKLGNKIYLEFNKVDDYSLCKIYTPTLSILSSNLIERYLRK